MKKKNVSIHAHTYLYNIIRIHTHTFILICEIVPYLSHYKATYFEYFELILS